MEKTKTGKIESLVKQSQVQEWISKGKTRQFIMDQLMEDGMCWKAAQNYYYDTLSIMNPDPNLLQEYRQTAIQQNLDRLEKIIDKSIDGNAADKNIALKAIDTLNKMIQAYGDNGVVINKDGQGNEQIIIKFDR